LFRNSPVQPLQMESTGKVAAMVLARIEQKPEWFCVWDESQVVSDVNVKGRQNFGTSQGSASQIGTPLRQGVGRPQAILARWLPKFCPAIRALPS